MDSTAGQETPRRDLSRDLATGAVGLGPTVFLLLWLAVVAFSPPVPAPSPVQPVPVLLVPGWYSEGTDLEPLATRLAAAGWPEDRIQAITFEDPVGSNEAHALEVGRAIDGLRAATGAPQVDIVAHSMGGLAVRASLTGRPQADVRRVVFLGTPQRGTWVAYLAWGEGGKEMEPDSEFLAELNRRDPVPESVSAMTIRTPLDTHVLPGENATLPGALDIEVCCPTHPGLMSDTETFLFIQTFLAEGPEAVAARRAQ